MGSPSVQKTADFLLYLHRDLKPSVSAFRGYRSLLGFMFKRQLPRLSANFVLRDLLRSFALARPRSFVSFPPWDVNKVLDALFKPPYEPLSKASFVDMSKKVLFLTSLATVKRVSELRSVSRKVSRRGHSLFSLLCSFLRSQDGVSVESFTPSFRKQSPLRNLLVPPPRRDFCVLLELSIITLMSLLMLILNVLICLFLPAICQGPFHLMLCPSFYVR